MHCVELQFECSKPFNVFSESELVVIDITCTERMRSILLPANTKI